jgi:hypothetical protein
MDEWLTRARDSLADAAGLEPEQLELSSSDEKTLLDLARIAAHASGPMRRFSVTSSVARRAVMNSTRSPRPSADRRPDASGARAPPSNR